MIPRSTDGKTRVLALSYGKDSMACLGALEKLQWPLDRIVTADVWATDTIPADPPPMMEFKGYADREILERYGITVEHYSAMDKDGKKVTYNSLFYRRYKPETVAKRARAGKKFGYYDPGRVIWGFPVVQGPWCNSQLKVAALNQAKKATKNSITIVGIAADEPIRIERARKKHQLLPLVEVGWSEADCRRWSEEHGLLSPIYTQATRGGVLVLPQSECWPASPHAEAIPGFVGDDDGMGQRFHGTVPRRRTHDTRLRQAFPTGGRGTHRPDGAVEVDETGGGIELQMVLKGGNNERTTYIFCR